MLKDKKAQAQIIVTVLIILLVLALVVIIWQVARGTVEKGAEQVEAQTQCIGVSMTIEDATCTADVSGIAVTVKRGADSALTKDEDNVKVLALNKAGTSVNVTGTVPALGTATLTVTEMAGTETTVTVALVLADGTLCEGETETFTCATTEE